MSKKNKIKKNKFEVKIPKNFKFIIFDFWILISYVVIKKFNEVKFGIKR